MKALPALPTLPTLLCLPAAAFGCLIARAAEVPAAAWFPQAPELPEPTGQVIRVENPAQLFDAVGTVKPGGTILLADGRYRMPRYLEISTNNVTLRGESGDRNRVILDGAASSHGELVGISNCEDVTLAHLTVANVKWNAIKINSDRGARRVRVYDCVIHNVWQRGIKGPLVPPDKLEEFRPRDCRVEYCLFYNDRPKRFSDDGTDTPGTFNGNYVAGIDVMYAEGWIIRDNVFLGIQGRTREGRAAVFLWQDSRNCVVERNLILDCDVGIALGNPSRRREPVHAVACVVRANMVVGCPETGILACHTKDCVISNNAIHDPESRLRRLIWVQQANDGLRLEANLLIGPPARIDQGTGVVQAGTLVAGTLAEAETVGPVHPDRDVPTPAAIGRALAFAEARAAEAGPDAARDPPFKPMPEKVMEAMRRVQAGFHGREGYEQFFPSPGPAAWTSITETRTGTKASQTRVSDLPSPLARADWVIRKR